MGAPLLPLHRDDQAETAYLARLGERVRAWRTEHAMTRKALALASGVSERYLAQLEGGQGNISVLLLRKLAHAMQVPVELLVREHNAPARAGRVALLGLRGAGKSTLGARLAQALQLPFIELDREVEKEAGAPLAEVFSMYGQEAFRRFERKALARVLKQLPRAVIRRYPKRAAPDSVQPASACVAPWGHASSPEATRHRRLRTWRERDGTCSGTIPARRRPR